MDSLLALTADPTVWAALATLIVMEVVLGIDNLIFISILTNKLPEEQRNRARRIGIGLALWLRLLLLGTIAWIVQLTQPLFELFGNAFSWRDLILIAGGLFLVWKATREIHHTVDPDPESAVFGVAGASIGFGTAIVQILLLDLVFSLDSIITAVGMTDHVPVMVIAVVVAVLVMRAAASPLAAFLQDNMEVSVDFIEGKPVSIVLPKSVVLKVVEADPVVKGQTAASSYKPGLLENGLKVMIPPFIEAGTKIVVNTEDVSYVERAK